MAIKRSRSRKLTEYEKVHHPCAVPDCQLQIPPKDLFCQSHWKALTAESRESIALAWQYDNQTGKHPSPRFTHAITLAVRQLTGESEE